MTSPLNVRELEAALQILQQDNRILRVNAALVPNPRQGEAVLQVRVVEARPWAIRLAGNNYNSPSIGAAREELLLEHHNVTGFGVRSPSSTRGRGDDRAYEPPLGIAISCAVFAAQVAASRAWLAWFRFGPVMR